MKAKIIRAAVGAAIASAGLCTATSAFASPDDDAFAAAYRRELAREAVANSKTNFEVKSTTDARRNANCDKLKVVKTQAIQRTVQQHMPPDPTKVIENTTCFQNVLQTKIPSTGFGFADQMISALISQYSGGGCNKSIGQWSGTMNAVQSGNYKAVLGSAQTYMQSGAGGDGGLIVPTGTSVGSSGGYSQVPSGSYEPYPTRTQPQIPQSVPSVNQPAGPITSFLGSITGNGN